MPKQPGPSREISPRGQVQEISVRAYTDNTFTTLQPIDPKWTHLGILGPALQAEVGDTLKVTFKNNTPFPASMHPHGVLYTKANEGAGYADNWTDAPGLFPSAQPRARWKVHRPCG